LTFKPKFAILIAESEVVYYSHNNPKFMMKNYKITTLLVLGFMILPSVGLAQTIPYYPTYYPSDRVGSIPYYGNYYSSNTSGSVPYYGTNYASANTYGSVPYTSYSQPTYTQTASVINTAPQLPSTGGGGSAMASISKAVSGNQTTVLLLGISALVASILLVSVILKPRRDIANQLAA
jgi:hypothetical protein